VKVAANTVTLEPGATNWTQCVCPPNFYANWTAGSGNLPNKAAGEECKPCDKDIVNCTRPGAFLPACGTAAVALACLSLGFCDLLLGGL
jgi:hypothetical protein